MVGTRTRQRRTCLTALVATVAFAITAAAPTAHAQSPNPNTDSGQGTVPVPTATPKPAQPAPTPTVAPITPAPTATAPAPSTARPPAVPAPATAELSSRQLRRAVRPLAGCIPTLPKAQRRVIVRRAGVRGFDQITRSEVATRLGLSTAEVATREQLALRSLRAAARARDCVADSDGQPAGAARPHSKRASGGGKKQDKSKSAVAAVVEPARSFAADHPTSLVIALAIALLCAALLVREVWRF
jgi:hypothetical protein